jgi:hypothetical protein
MPVSSAARLAQRGGARRRSGRRSRRCPASGWRPGTHAFDTTTRAEGLALAAQAAVAARGARTEEHLRTAITTRTVIGQAQGVLMDLLKITADEAFGILSRASSDTNVKLRSVAR